MRLIDDKQIRNILVRCTNWVGDCIMTTPALKVIRENFPSARISALAKPWVRDVLVANPSVDEVISYGDEYRGLKGQMRLAGELSLKGFDLAILLQNAFEAAWITRLAGIPRRAGYNTDARSLLLTHKVVLKKETRKIHQVYYYLRMLEGLGLDITGREPELFLQPQNSDALSIERILIEERAGHKPFLIGINPGAAYGPAKRWLPEYFLEVIRRLVKATGCKVIIFGTKADYGIGEEARLASPDRVLNLAGRTTLGEAIAAIAQCRVFVTNDSGLMHVGAALNVPLVAIFGSTNPVTTGPFSRRARIIRKEFDCSPCLKTVCPSDFRCMKSIRPEEVFDAVVKLIEEYGN
ncbi:MAG: lipopolysaccharide heptosyltransferase II [Pseudomonadota bacterium]